MKSMWLVGILALSACAVSSGTDVKLGDDEGDTDNLNPDGVGSDDPADPVIDTSPFDGPDTAADDNPDVGPYPVDTGFGNGFPGLFDSGLLGGLGGLFDSGGLFGGGGNPLGGLFDTADTGGWLFFRPATVSYGPGDADLFEFP
jgi:hypothetical protein